MHRERESAHIVYDTYTRTSLLIHYDYLESITIYTADKTSLGMQENVFIARLLIAKLSRGIYYFNDINYIIQYVIRLAIYRMER